MECWREGIILTWALESSNENCTFSIIGNIVLERNFIAHIFSGETGSWLWNNLYAFYLRIFQIGLNCKLFFLTHEFKKMIFFLFSNDHVMYLFCYFLFHCTDKSHVKIVELMESWNFELMDSWNIEFRDGVMKFWIDGFMKCWISRWSHAMLNFEMESRNVKFWDGVMQC